MAGMWFSGRGRDKHERGGLRYAAAAAVLAAAPAAARNAGIARSAEAWSEHRASAGLHRSQRKLWNLRLIC